MTNHKFFDTGLVPHKPNRFGPNRIGPKRFGFVKALLTKLLFSFLLLALFRIAITLVIVHKTAEYTVGYFEQINTALQTLTRTH